MRNSPPPERRVAQGPVTVDALRPWRTFARAHQLPRPESHGPQAVPTGLLCALVTPVFTSQWMGTQDPALLMAPPNTMTVAESRAGKLDPAHPLTVELHMLSTAAWEAVCTQGKTSVGKVSWTWLT